LATSKQLNACHNEMSWKLCYRSEFYWILGHVDFRPSPCKDVLAAQMQWDSVPKFCYFSYDNYSCHCPTLSPPSSNLPVVQRLVRASPHEALHSYYAM